MSGQTLKDANKENIFELQTYLRYISRFEPSVPTVSADGIYGAATREAVEAFQRKHSMKENGEADYQTWTRIVEVYDELKREHGLPRPVHVYPLEVRHFKEGDDFDEIYILQLMLRRLSKIFENISNPELTGVFDKNTVNSVNDFKTHCGLEANALVDRATWNSLADIYSALTHND